MTHTITHALTASGKTLRRLGRGVAVAIDGLLGALCGVLAWNLLRWCWDAIGGCSEIRASLLTTNWDACTTAALAAGMVAGIGCAVLHPRRNTSCISAAVDQRTREFLKRLERRISGREAEARRKHPGPRRLDCKREARVLA
jgi:hypothetical protein